MKNIKNAALAVLLSLGVMSSANAAIYRWSFSTVDQTDFAFLDFDTVTSDFRIFDNAANDYLTSPRGVNGISFDFNGSQTLNPTAATSSVSIGSLSQTVLPPLNSGYVIGFATASNGVDDEVNDGESTTFNFGAIDFANIDNVALRLNGNNGVLGAQGGQAWVGGTLVQSTPVPEAETSAMMALGLGMIGFMAKRRKKA